MNKNGNKHVIVKEVVNAAVSGKTFVCCNYFITCLYGCKGKAGCARTVYLSPVHITVDHPSQRVWNPTKITA